MGKDRLVSGSTARGRRTEADGHAVAVRRRPPNYGNAAAQLTSAGWLADGDVTMQNEDATVLGFLFARVKAAAFDTLEYGAPHSFYFNPPRSHESFLVSRRR